VITPRRTRLLRAPTLAAFQRAIADTVAGCGGGPAPAAVLTPTREAARQLRRTLDAAGVDRPRAALVTRSEWYEWLRERLDSCPRVLTAVEREVVAAAAAADAAAAGAAPPFRLRPGIVAALLAFYDQLRRHRRSVDAFERLLVDELEPSAEFDRGARRLLLQTRFLVAAFRAYDRRLDTLDGLDEHRLRERLLAGDAAHAVSEIVVTVPDQAAHTAGLYPADFDVLARLPGLARVTLIATDAVLDSGFRERLDDWLPGLAESRVESAARPAPALVAPAAAAERPYFAWRDREEELRGIARAVRRAVVADGRSPAAAAVVVQRPLPYLYLAPSVFGAASLAVRAGEALPLAIEPYAAAVDLVLAFAAGRFGREPALALLRSPHFGREEDGPPPAPAAIRALDLALSEARFAGGLETLHGYADAWREAAGTRRAALPALRRVIALADELAPLLGPRTLAAQLATLRSFLQRRERTADPDAAGERTVEGRTRVLRGLEALEAADRALNRPGDVVDVADVALVVRRWIESQTFGTPAPAEGVHLVDVHAAAYGRFDDVFVAGMVESEWPERTSRNIFYPGGLLAGLGWPRERDRQRASRAAFHDLLGLAAERVWLSTFNLEDDAVVAASPLLEDLEGLDVARIPAPDPAAGGRSPDEPAASAAADRRRRWEALRTARAAADGGDRRAPGFAGRQPARAYTVSALERYAACPFQYFAHHALGLEAERTAQQTMTAEQRGLMLHRVFESFFRDWQAAGFGAVTLANREAALERFASAAEEAIAGLPPVDRAVARGWLLGSAAAPGLAERVFVAEIEDQTGVAERLLEYRIDGRFELGRGPGRRTVAVRGVVDRIDLHADRTFRVIDYKASRPPHRAHALQLPVYARCAERQLHAERGPGWRATEALYFAFGDPRLQVAVPGGDVAAAMDDGEARVVELVEAIEAGHYPPRPIDRARCASCAFPTVCRKDYVDDA
jgi:RecB family exonuclease